MKAKIKEFESANGLKIIAGQTDESNDYVSFKLSSANDLWFHVHGFPGSHVLLKCSDSNADKESIREAAETAAYFSKMRNASSVNVSYCPAKNVSKTKGAKKGQVKIKGEKKIKVSPKLPKG